MQITEINCETGEVVERDMTSEELAKHEAELTLIAESEAQAEANRLSQENAAAAKASAEAKLAAIGLTPDEISALIK
jgi:hypothetical protein